MSRTLRLAVLLFATAAPLAGGALAQKPPPLTPADNAPAPNGTAAGKPPPLGQETPARPQPPAARPPATPPAAASGGKPPPLGQAEPAPPTRPARPPAATTRPAPATGAGAGKPPPLPPGQEQPRSEGREASSGTGFVVANRRVLTNHHVANGCTGLRLRLPGGTEVRATLTASDADADLALLTAEGDLGPALPFRETPEIRRGEGVVTYGFPLSGILSSGPTLTTGDISALQGLRNNDTQYQISAPVQPGNSGGPLLDLAGNVVGVIVSKLNAQRIAERTGDIPQNVNFAVKGTTALTFLRAHQVQPRLSVQIAPRSPADVGEVANPSTLFIRCLR